MLLDGIPVQVGENLEQAMRQLRHKDKSRMLWVDALCIHQKDDQEKTEQVGKMREIYQRAADVIAWLGPKQSSTELAMDWISRVSDPTANLEYPLDYMHHDLKTALIQFFDLPYWSRIWVVQELFNSKELLYQCGNMTLTRNQLREAVNFLRDLKKEFWDLCRNPERIVDLCACREKPTLLYLLRSFRSFSASLPQDKVFALLGLARDTNGVTPNYSFPCQIVYTSLARNLIDAGYIDILSLCETRRPQRDDLLVPSWVPDWSWKSPRNPLQQRHLDRGTTPLSARLEPTYNTCGAWRQSVAIDERKLQQANAALCDTVLRLQVVIIGQVQRQGSCWDCHAGKWLYSILELVDDVDEYSNTEERFKTALRTAVADQQLRELSKDDLKLRMETDLLRDVYMALQARSLPDIDDEEFWDLNIAQFYVQMWCLAWERRPFTMLNYIGLGPTEAIAGDFVCIVYGSDVPYIVRRRRNGTFRLIGEAYVDGIMDGEVMAGLVTKEVIEIF